ncbi:MAG: FAD-binding oxidoreductase [Acidimicrobiales bacterium]
MSDLIEELERIVGSDAAWVADTVRPDDTHDETLGAQPVVPLAVVRPGSANEVCRILELADSLRVPVVARGSGTGLSGAARPLADGIVVAFDRMNRILEVDTANQVAVVEPGVTLADLDAELRPLGLMYPVYPGEMSASLGGNVATNAGGMRAIRYGVTRHHVLGLELVLPGGEVIRTGGRYVKSSSGYDLTQLVIGSEGTLALVTEVTLKLVPRLPHLATLLAPFATLDQVTASVPTLVSSGVAPLILEYIDALAMAGITRAADLDLGVPADVQAATVAYLVVMLESAHEDRLAEDVQTAAAVLAEAGADDVYVLPSGAGADLIAARERAFFVSKAAGAHDIIDTVVPRAAIAPFMTRVAGLVSEHQAFVSACGHVGDGNVHLSVFQPDEERRHGFVRAVLAAAVELGGAVSGEHGLGTEKQGYYFELEDPVKLALMRRIKAAFDPHGILGPGRGIDESPAD